MASESIPQRTCKFCRNSYPLTTEYWPKDKKGAHGLGYRCKECNRKVAKKWAEDNRERMLENKARYYAEHKEQFQQYWADNAEHLAEWKREWRKANPEKVKAHKSASQKRHREAARERTRRYNQKYPEKRRVNVANRYARKIKAEGKYTPADITQLYEEQEGHCAYCGITLHDEYHVDHVIALSRRGTNWPDNLALTCPTCNHSKNNHLLSEWELLRGW